MRLIDAELLEEKLADNMTIWHFNRQHDGILKDIIDNVPTVDCSNELGEMTFSHSLTTEERQDLTRAFLIGKRSEQRPQGEWKYLKHGYYECSECKYVPYAIKSNFCPNCGADMKKRTKTE